MACYIDEDEVWKCPTHPSKRRKTGICPTCLRDRLAILCPDCATLRPCFCCATTPATTTTDSSSSSSSTSSSSFSLFGSRREQANATFGRSRSLAIPFLRSRSKFVGAGEFNTNIPLPPVSRSKTSFWSIFKLKKKVHKGSDGEKSDGECKKNDELTTVDEYSTMKRSRSVAIGVGAGVPLPKKGRRGWYFLTPMKGFRSSKVVHERSPLH